MALDQAPGQLAGLPPDDVARVARGDRQRRYRLDAERLDGCPVLTRDRLVSLELGPSAGAEFALAVDARVDQQPGGRGPGQGFLVAECADEIWLHGRDRAAAAKGFHRDDPQFAIRVVAELAQHAGGL